MPSFHPIGTCPPLPPEHFGRRPLFGSSLGPTSLPFTRLARQLLRQGAGSHERCQLMNVLHVHLQFGPLARAVSLGDSYGIALHEDGPLRTFCLGSRLKRTRHRGIVSSGIDLICNAMAMQAVAGPLSILKSRRVNRQSRRSSERRPNEAGGRHACAPYAACFQDATPS
jgi:hypothetical protein